MVETTLSIIQVYSLRPGMLPTKEKLQIYFPAIYLKLLRTTILPVGQLRSAAR